MAGRPTQATKADGPLGRPSKASVPASAMASPSLCNAASFEGRLTPATVSVGAAGEA
jgi:hypothetical protein